MVLYMVIWNPIFDGTMHEQSRQQPINALKVDAFATARAIILSL